MAEIKKVQLPDGSTYDISVDEITDTWITENLADTGTDEDGNAVTAITSDWINANLS